ncbi:hypothetical protein BH11PLA2_BH11PLA2_10680 [soil metagenome]
MKKFVFAVAAIVVAMTANTAFAGGCSGPYCQGAAKHSGGKPVFQAAPWYLYWPYNAHFQTPAPMMGAYYAPPSAGGMLQSPYFPAPQAAPNYQR